MPHAQHAHQRPAPSPDATAAQTIQRYWRQRFSRRTTAKILHRAIHTIGISRERFKTISFETLVVALRERPLISAMRAALQRMHLLATFRHGSPSKSLSPENVNVRVFLAAYMIAYRPTHVFEAMGAMEQALFESAVPMLNEFHAMCDALMQAPFRHFQMVPAALTKEFPTTLFEFLRRFKAWKVPDEAKLSCRIRHALVALYQAEEHLPPDEPSNSKLKIEFRTQIDRLRGKLQQIAGQEALDKFDADRLAGTFANAGIHATATAGGGYAALPGRTTNEQLAHELLLDPEFRLDETGGSNVGNPVFNRIRESFHRAFWDSLVDDLKLDTPCYARVLRVLAEVRDGIAELAGAREEGSIADILDTEFIKQRIDGGTYAFGDAARLIQQVVVVILRVQAPRRDDETKEKWAALQAKIAGATPETAARVICEGLEFLLDRVNVMRIDAANARFVWPASPTSPSPTNTPPTTTQAPADRAGDPRPRHRLRARQVRRQDPRQDADDRADRRVAPASHRRLPRGGRRQRPRGLPRRLQADPRQRDRDPRRRRRAPASGSRPGDPALRRAADHQHADRVRRAGRPRVRRRRRGRHQGRRAHPLGPRGRRRHHGHPGHRPRPRGAGADGGGRAQGQGRHGPGEPGPQPHAPPDGGAHSPEHRRGGCFDLALCW